MDQYTPMQAYNAYLGSIDVEHDRQMEQWRQTRLLISYMYNLTGKTTKKNIKPQDVIALPGEKPAKKGASAFKDLTKEQLEKIFKK
jgi:hypothetical protein